MCGPGIHEEVDAMDWKGPRKKLLRFSSTGPRLDARVWRSRATGIWQEAVEGLGQKEPTVDGNKLASPTGRFVVLG
jgi:hypothetical protein